MTGYSLPMQLTAKQWGMPGPLGPRMRLPATNLYLHHTVTPVSDDPVHDAQLVAREGIARFGLASYSVMVHPARVIFWAQMEHRGAHTFAHNSSGLGLALIGNYDRDDVPDSMVYDACVALSVLRSFGLLSPAPAVLGHREVRPTICPGQHAVAKVLPMLRLVAADPGWTA